MRSMRNVIGYVPLYRSLLDWEWYDNTDCVRVMIHLLLTANWEPKKWHGQTVQPGQLITSMEGIAKDLGMTRGSVRRVFDKLKKSGEVTVQTNNHWTTVTVANWDKYQITNQPSGQPLIQQKTNQQPTNNQPPATTKEDKKVRNKEVRGVEDRKLDFIAACKSVMEKTPDRMTMEQKKPFLDYWTEPTSDGTKMRFESEKFFSHGRRMDTWMLTAEKIASKGNGFNSSANGKTYDGWTVERIEAWMNDYKANNGGSYPNSGTANVPKAYKLWKEWI